jgi:hypothetical protein
VKTNAVIRSIIERRILDTKRMIAAKANDLATVASWSSDCTEDERDDALRYINLELCMAIEQLRRLNAQLDEAVRPSLTERLYSLWHHPIFHWRKRTSATKG